MKKPELLNLIAKELDIFNSIKNHHVIVQNSIPIVWFGDSEKYFNSELKIVTVSLNPSDIEFKKKKSDIPSTHFRFPDYDGTVESLYSACNKYFSQDSYGSWFKASFGSVLKGFSASHYNNEKNTALHTDIGCSYATSPTWGGLTNAEKSILEPIGSVSWHSLVEILEPDIILFSASENYEKKIRFPQIGNWSSINVNAKRPLLKGAFKLSSNKEAVVLFQIQGRKPFLQTAEEEKLKFNKHI